MLKKSKGIVLTTQPKFLNRLKLITNFIAVYGVLYEYEFCIV